MKITTILQAITCLLLGACTDTQKDILSAKVKELEAENTKLKKKAAVIEALEAVPLQEVVEQTISVCRTNISPALKAHLADMYTRVSGLRLEGDRIGQMFYVSIHCQESGLKPDAQSPTGPKGLGQMAKAAFHEGLEKCGMPKAKDEDVWIPELNATASACYFKYLLTLAGPGRYTVALAAYNQGPNSEAVKNLQKYGNLREQESTAYVSDIHNRVEQAKNEIIKTQLAKTDNQQ